MGRWTYYSPSYIGAAVAALLLATYGQFLGGLPAWGYWAYVIGVPVAAGLACQLLMLGAQGAFAQVLPAAGGRSVRGSGAMLAGWLLIFGEVLSIVALLLRVEHADRAATIIGCLGVLTLLGAVATYVWLWPTAVRDFANER